jgi:hypothetical protein
MGGSIVSGSLCQGWAHNGLDSIFESEVILGHFPHLDRMIQNFRDLKVRHKRYLLGRQGHYRSSRRSLLTEKAAEMLEVEVSEFE